MKAGIVALIIGALAAPISASAQSFDQFIGFGDSTVDSGWYRNLAFPSGNPLIDAALPAAVANGGGISTTGPGPVSSQVLANDFGLSATPANQGGSNYATGGARNNQSGSLPNAISAVAQIHNYLAAAGGAANSNALYLVGSGANDITLYVNQVNAHGITLGQGAQNVVQSGNDLATAISQLYMAGARYILVPNQPASFGTAVEQSLRAAYNNSLWSGLASRNVDFIPVDFNAVLGAVVANPSLFGFIVAAGPACVQPAGVTSGYAILCTPLTLVAPDAAQTHLLADDVHLTTAGQKVLADYEYGLVVAPSMVSMLAETPLKTRAGLINTIQNQILVSQGQRGQAGFNTWLSGDFASLRTSNYPGFPGQSGDPAALAAGFGYRLPQNFLVGVAISAGRQRVDFSDGFGGFSQSEFSVSLYGAGTIGPLWFDTTATYGTIDDNVHRIVPVGVTLQNNAASVSGSDISLSGEIGYNFHFSSIVHGPVAGMELQQVLVGSFTETGSFTSLGFGSQTRKSVVSEFGYRVAFKFERFSPFIKAVWNHEFASTDRQVSASLTTSQAPEYSMPAAQFGSDWASLTAGTAIKLDRNLTGLVALTSTMAQQSVASFGGQVGINVSF